MFEPENRYKTGLISYVIIFFIVNIFITLIIQSIFFSIQDINGDIFNEITQSNNMLIYLGDNYLNTEYFSTIKTILIMSSVGNFVIYLILFAVCIFVYKKDILFDLKFLKNKYNPLCFIFITLFIFIIYYSLTLLSGVLVQMINNLFKVDTSINQQTIVEILKVSPVLMFISAGILGPIVEELIFRKSIFGLIKSKKKALIISTLAFALIHVISSIGAGYNVIQLIVLTLPYLTGGLIFGVIYIIVEKNIIIPCIIHILSNIIAMIISMTIGIIIL